MQNNDLCDVRYPRESSVFRSVMRQIRLRKNDTLYILGDVMYYSDTEDGNKPESEMYDIIDTAAKRILGVYRDAFTELAKGPDT